MSEFKKYDKKYLYLTVVKSGRVKSCFFRWKTVCQFGCQSVTKLNNEKKDDPFDESNPAWSKFDILHMCSRTVWQRFFVGLFTLHIELNFVRGQK